MSKFQPLAVIGGVPTKAGIKFNHPTHEMIVSNHQAVVWAVLELCDGQSDCDYIVKKAAKATGEPESLVSEIIDDLVDVEVLVDSRFAYRAFHRLGNNLPSFAMGLSPTEVYELQTSEHLPRKQGERVSLVRGATGHIAQLGLMRESVRAFAPAPITRAQLDELLEVAYSEEIAASPSAGGMYPIRLYAIVTRSVEDIGTGLYEYDSSSHSLIRFAETLDRPALEFALNSDTLLYGAPIVLVVAAEMNRQPRKYANRGYRYSLIEAGHVAQNVHLVSQELGLSTLEYCGFQDDRLADVLGVADQEIEPLLTLAVGHARSDRSTTIEETADQLVTDLVGPGKPVNWVKLVNSPRNGEDYSFFHFISHFRAGSHDNARASYRDRLCGGTSTSFALANIKAVAEAYERYRSGQVRIDEVRAADTFGARRWVDPRVFAPYSEEQVAYFSTLRAFSSEEAWEWVRGYDYETGEPVMVPVDLVYYPLAGEKFGRTLCHYANSSGVAAHTSVESAVQGGLLELIERDAIMRNWANKTVAKRIPVDALPIHWQRRKGHWESKGHSVEFLDFSRDGVAIITVVIHSDEHYPHFVTGTSASIESLDAAYTKAFQEAELTLIHLRDKGEKQLKAEDLASPMDHGYFYAQNVQAERLGYLWSGGYAVPSKPSATFDELVERYKPIVVDISGEYPYLKVARVFSSELIPVNFGYGADHIRHTKFPEVFRKKHFSEVEPHYLA